MAALTLSSAACGSDGGGGSGSQGIHPASPPSGAPSGDAAPQTPSPSKDDVALEEAEQLAVRDLADRIGVAATESVEVESSEQVTWRDGSMGCPQPDHVYTQSLVAGYRIVLTVEGETYAYHGQQGAAPFYCEEPAEDATVDEDR